MFQPALKTTRLCLRALTLDDAGAIERLLDTPEIAAMTSQVPYPYPKGLAHAWIERQPGLWERSEGVVWGLVRRADDRLIGVISVQGLKTHAPELGYWVGVGFWGQGYASEAATSVVRFAFDQLRLHRLSARRLYRNPASGAVLVKAGLRVVAHSIEWRGNGRGYEPVIHYACARLDSHLAPPLS